MSFIYHIIRKIDIYEIKRFLTVILIWSFNVLFTVYQQTQKWEKFSFNVKTDTDIWKSI